MLILEYIKGAMQQGFYDLSLEFFDKSMWITHDF